LQWHPFLWRGVSSSGVSSPAASACDTRGRSRAAHACQRAKSTHARRTHARPVPCGSDAPWTRFWGGRRAGCASPWRRAWPPRGARLRACSGSSGSCTTRRRPYRSKCPQRSTRSTASGTARQHAEEAQQRRAHSLSDGAPTGTHGPTHTERLCAQRPPRAFDFLQLHLRHEEPPGHGEGLERRAQKAASAGHSSNMGCTQQRCSVRAHRRRLRRPRRAARPRPCHPNLASRAAPGRCRRRRRPGWCGRAGVAARAWQTRRQWAFAPRSRPPPPPPCRARGRRRSAASQT
jgi:hypothetical protein